MNAADVADLVDTSGGLAQLQAIKDVTLTGAGKVVGGSGVLVTGTLTIATGLTTITSFQTTLLSTGGTGTSQAQVLVATLTTGSALVTAFYVNAVGASGALAAASGSTGSFSYFAYGS